MTKLGSRCQCIGCDRLFNSVSAFDKHQILVEGHVVCRDPETLDMVLLDSGFWATSRQETSAWESLSETSPWMTD